MHCFPHHASHIMLPTTAMPSACLVRMPGDTANSAEWWCAALDFFCIYLFFFLSNLCNLLLGNHLKVCTLLCMGAKYIQYRHRCVCMDISRRNYASWVTLGAENTKKTKWAHGTHAHNEPWPPFLCFLGCSQRTATLRSILTAVLAAAHSPTSLAHHAAAQHQMHPCTWATTHPHHDSRSQQSDIRHVTCHVTFSSHPESHPGAAHWFYGQPGVMDCVGGTVCVWVGLFVWVCRGACGREDNTSTGACYTMHQYDLPYYASIRAVL